jgi:hypothetical protein
VVTNSQEKFGKFVQGEIAKRGKVIQTAKIGRIDRRSARAAQWLVRKEEIFAVPGQ